MQSNTVSVFITGSPTLDRKLIKSLPEITENFKSSIILLHRPDEIASRYPDLGGLLATLRNVGIVMLGDLLIDALHYNSIGLNKRVIPHGFFDLPTAVMDDPVLVGAHTTWGDMRSVSRAIDLIVAIREISTNPRILGYLGGFPETEVSETRVAEILTQKGFRSQFQLRHLQREDWSTAFGDYETGTILLHPGHSLPNIDLTFNLQLYHLGTGVRLGESSGSLHSSGGIPVGFGNSRLSNINTEVAAPSSYVPLRHFGTLSNRSGSSWHQVLNRWRLSPPSAVR